MDFFWAVIALLVAIIWVISIVDIMGRGMGGKRTAAWLLIVVLLPFIGSLIYWLRREPKPDEAEAQLAAQQDLARAPSDPGGRTQFPGR